MLDFLPPLCWRAAFPYQRGPLCRTVKSSACTERTKLFQQDNFNYLPKQCSVMESQTAWGYLFLNSHRTLQSSGRKCLQSLLNLGPCRRWHLSGPTQSISKTFFHQPKEECVSFSLRLLEFEFFLATPPQVLHESKLPGKLLVFNTDFKNNFLVLLL